LTFPLLVLGEVRWGISSHTVGGRYLNTNLSVVINDTFTFGGGLSVDLKEGTTGYNAEGGVRLYRPLSVSSGYYLTVSGGVISTGDSRFFGGAAAGFEGFVGTVPARFEVGFRFFDDNKVYPVFGVSVGY